MVGLDSRATMDMSIDETGFARLDRLSFDAYNESDVLIEFIKNYHQRTRHYPVMSPGAESVANPSLGFIKQNS